MAVSFSTTLEKSAQSEAEIRGRFEACLCLETGETAFPLTRLDPLYDEMPISFGRVVHTQNWASATEWSQAAFLKLIDIVHTQEFKARPIHLPLPLGILTEDNAALRLCRVCEDNGYCPQEFMLEFQDASLASGSKDCMDRLDDFRRFGFRIALDARRSAATPFSKRLRGAIERLRVNPIDLMQDEMLQLRADIVSCIGGEVILDRANWRDVEELQRCGATHAMKLMSDA